MAETVETARADEGTNGERRNRKSTLLLLGGLVGGLLLGGAAMYVVGLGGEEAGAPADTTAGAETVAEPEEDPIDLLVVNVRRFAVPMITDDKALLGYVWVDLAFEVDGPDNQSYVSARLPELRDAFLRDLYTRQTVRSDRPGALDFDLLQARLETAAQQTLGEERILAVRIVNARRVPE